MSRCLHLPANTAGRDFVVGDLHGCYDDLQNLLSQAKFDPTRDRLFSVGDLIDRGSKNAECIRLLEQPWFFSVMGNHEAMMIDACVTESAPDGFSPSMHMWMSNGGSWVLGHTSAEIQDFLHLIADLPLAIVVGDQPDNRFGIVHAEWHGNAAQLLSGDYSEHTEAVMLWDRDILRGCILPDMSEFPIYVGHSIVNDVTEVGCQRYIDTGSFLAKFGRGFMTMIEASPVPPGQDRIYRTKAFAPELEWEL